MTDSTQAATTRGRGTTKVGVVVSHCLDKTVTVKVVTPTRHRLYLRTVRRTSKFMAHDPENRCTSGDTVEIVECRPLSKRKRWRVTRIVRAAPARGGTQVKEDRERAS
ncbi:MAG: 30S ribosomal protein S17 [Acidobacteriota bacterium]